MSPKSATISLLLLFLTLASLTLSSAATDNDCDGYPSVPALLKHYGLPGGFFPANVMNFSCVPDEVNPAALRLKIVLKKSCTVTRGFIVTNALEYESDISAIISTRELSRINGVRVKLTGPFRSIFSSDTLDLTVKDVRVFVFPSFKIIQFFSAEGPTSPASPPFPMYLLPSDPPHCDHSTAAALDYSGSARVAKNNQDAPLWVYKYGRLLPVVVAA